MMTFNPSRTDSIVLQISSLVENSRSAVKRGKLSASNLSGLQQLVKSDDDEDAEAPEEDVHEDAEEDMRNETNGTST